MLDQRGAEERGYITLKEAAKISGYSSDYIGQLIRSGKIEGEQIYCNVAWVTTPEALTRYEKSRHQQEPATIGDLLLAWCYKYARPLLYILITVLLLLLLFLQYILYVAIDARLGGSYDANQVTEPTESAVGQNQPASTEVTAIKSESI